MDTVRTAAARNNAQWCDIVCRTHGLPTEFDVDGWSSGARTPTLYPDAVTLVPEPSVPGLLARIDTSAGSSIKDSFASVDLAPFGFGVLFEAEWIVRPPGPPTGDTSGPRWERVRDSEGFAEWERAWRGDDGPHGVLRAELLDHDDVVVVGASTNGRIVAGAILNASAAAAVVGISNFFTVPASDATGWPGCLAFAGSRFPAATLVGYESGDDLRAALASGFAAAGKLRVWTNGA
jgi:hypothetical protein